jgi:hypothetical protein
MTVAVNFKHADDVITHLAALMPQLADPLLEPKYVGFAAVAAVTVYELAIKETFYEFASRKHEILEVFTKAHYDRLNGRIRIGLITDEYLPRFGSKYVLRFKNDLDATTAKLLRQNRRDIKNSYANIIIWRNEFAHQGGINRNVTFNEVATAYEDGKEVIHCLGRALHR